MASDIERLHKEALLSGPRKYEKIAEELKAAEAMARIKGAPDVYPDEEVHFSVDGVRALRRYLSGTGNSQFVAAMLLNIENELEQESATTPVTTTERVHEDVEYQQYRLALALSSIKIPQKVPKNVRILTSVAGSVINTGGGSEISDDTELNAIQLKSNDTYLVRSVIDDGQTERVEARLMPVEIDTRVLIQWNRSIEGIKRLLPQEQKTVGNARVFVDNILATGGSLSRRYKDSGTGVSRDSLLCIQAAWKKPQQPHSIQ